MPVALLARFDGIEADRREAMRRSIGSCACISLSLAVGLFLWLIKQPVLADIAVSAVLVLICALIAWHYHAKESALYKEASEIDEHACEARVLCKKAARAVDRIGSSHALSEIMGYDMFMLRQVAEETMSLLSEKYRAARVRYEACEEGSEEGALAGLEADRSRVIEAFNDFYYLRLVDGKVTKYLKDND